MLTPRISEYRPRLVDDEVTRRLRAAGALLMEGPRACGKTQTGLRHAASAVLLDRDPAARAAGELTPTLLLEGTKPRLIDEWQLVKGVWNAVRGDVDDHPGHMGRYILAGSAVPSDDQTRHTGSMRITRMRMRPMSLAESGHSTKEVSLAALFDGGDAVAPDAGLDIRAIAERIVVGGWPALLDVDPDDAQVATQGYLDETRRIDLDRLEGPNRDPENVARVVRSLARNTATEAAATTIAADVAGNERHAVDYKTVIEYGKDLARVFVVEDLVAWEPALRSRGELRKAPTRHFTDPSLAAAALGAGVQRLLKDPDTLGHLFESLVIRDLRVYAQAIDAQVKHYREAKGVEADAIVERRDGRWAAAEVKLGPGSVDEGAASLLRVASHIDTDRHGKPAFLAVITGWGYAYRRADNVLVIPIGALAP